MIGAVKSEAIYAQLAHLVSAHTDPWAERKTPMKELVRKAQEAGGSEDASGLGTAFHGLTEVLDGGTDPSYVPRQLEPWLNAYALAMQDWEPVLIEPFVVCDEIKAAGSPDRYIRHKDTGEVYCADIKSGANEPEYPMKVTMQVAIGAHSERYDQLTGQRTRIECSHDRGVLIHAPIRGSWPHVELYWLDLNRGWELSKLAYQVRESRRLPKLQKVNSVA